MKEFVLTALIFLPFYLIYTILGVNGYIIWKQTESQEAYYRTVFGIWLLIATSLVALIRIAFFLLKREYNYVKTVEMIIGANFSGLPVAFFFCAYTYDNMFNLDDPMYKWGLISTYSFLFLAGTDMTFGLYRANRTVGLMFGLLMTFIVIFVSCLIFGYYYNNPVTIASGYIFMTATIILGVLLIVYSHCSEPNDQNYIQF